MNISALKVSFSTDAFAVALSDGRVLHIPLVWFPRLLKASAEERNAYEISASGIHWDAIDEDVSVTGLLEGRGDITTRFGKAA
jgi:Protein of unknown function (DUF2442)